MALDIPHTVKTLAKKARITARAQQLKSLRSTKTPATDADTILIWRGPGALTASLNIELLLATALQERGARVIFFLCDGTSKGCVVRTIAEMPKVEDWAKACTTCHFNGQKMIETLGFEYYSTGDLISDAQITELQQLSQNVPLSEIKALTYKQQPAGLHALASAIRFFKGVETKASDPYYERVVREYLFTALVNIEAAVAVRERFAFDRLLIQHGIYADWAPFFDVMLEAGYPITRWMRSYLKNHLYLRTDRKGDSYHIYYSPQNDLEDLLNQPLSAKQKAELQAFFQSQISGDKNTHKLFQTDPEAEETVLRKLNFSNDKPIWGIFSHLNWDAQFSYEPMLYPDTTTWMLETVRAIHDITNVNWVIKIHPAERVVGTAFGAGAAIKKHFGKLPEHIRLLPPETDINTYGLLPILSGGVTISGTIGMEMAVRGKPAILAGEAHYGRKGFTIDPDSIDDYLQALQRADQHQKLTAEQQQKARRYAHYFFIRRQLPLTDLIAENGAKLHVASAKELQPGQHPVLDMICDRLLQGGEFILPA